MNEVYFDFNATTPTDPLVFKEMAPYFTEVFANPSSSSSLGALKAQSAIKISKKRISKALECTENEIYFTSGATESVNWVLNEFKNQKQKIFYSPLDHDATIACLKNYEHIKALSFNKLGEFDYEELTNLAKSAPSGSLFTFLLAHNELGTLLETKIIKTLKNSGHYVHLDATQAVGKIEVNFNELSCDFLSFSGHKLYGPKGIGGLLINSKTITEMKAFIFGGGQQSDLRSGTLNTPGIVGLGKACELAHENLKKNQNHFKKMKSFFIKNISNLDYTLNAPLENSLSNTINISINNWSSFKPLSESLKPYIVSQSSACSSGKSGSRVLNLLNVEPNKTIRISFGKDSSIEDVEGLVKALLQSSKA